MKISADCAKSTTNFKTGEFFYPPFTTKSGYFLLTLTILFYQLLLSLSLSLPLARFPNIGFCQSKPNLIFRKLKLNPFREWAKRTCLKSREFAGNDKIYNKRGKREVLPHLPTLDLTCCHIFPNFCRGTVPSRRGIPH